MYTQRQRLDTFLVERGLVESREKACRLIMAGCVDVEGVAIPKPGMRINADAVVRIHKRKERYVSRGGHKLAAALEYFGVNPAGCVCLDVGASTGGFTDCLLQKGARRVYPVDVGYGQLHYRLRSDPRIVLLERTNARYLSRSLVPEPIDIATIDVSFISLRLILPAVAGILRPAASVIALIKPQFEASRKKVPKGGVIKNRATHREVLEKMLDGFRKDGWVVMGLETSPIMGAAGNREYLAHLLRATPGREISPPDFNLDEIITRAFIEPHK